MIDIKTLMLLLAIGNFAVAMLMAGYARSATGYLAMRVWTFAKLVQGAAYLLGFLRPDLPYPWVGIAATLTLIASVALELAAYCLLFRLHRWERVLAPCALLAVLVFHSARLGGASESDLTVLMSLIVALARGATAWILLRAGTSLLQRVIGATHLVFFAAMSLCAANGVADGAMSVFAPTPVQAFTYLAGYVLMIVNGFGFLLLCKEQDDVKMERLATTDSLTELVNRRAYFERTESARMLSARLRQPITLMMLDIDHFKRLNDRFGHATGDEALCVFAATAQEKLRDHDIMGRLGGEEFALTLPGTDLAGALQAAERLRLAVAGACVPTSNGAYTMTVSIGVVLIDPDEHINAAMARADQALYAAKSGGRNRVEAGLVRQRA